MPPKSASKKEKPTWWNCEKCKTYFLTSELTKHQADGCGNLEGLSGYVEQSGAFHCRKVEIGNLASYEEVKLCTDTQRYGLALLPIGIVRRLGLSTGDYVTIEVIEGIEKKPVGSVVRKVWPIEDRVGAKVALETLDDIDALKVPARDMRVKVYAIRGEQLEDAVEISIHLEDPSQATLFSKNGKFLLTCLKNQLLESVIFINNPITLNVCNKKFRFRIDGTQKQAANDGMELADHLSRLRIGSRMLRIIRTTKLVLRDDSQEVEKTHKRRIHSLSHIGGLDSTISEIKELIEVAFGIKSTTASDEHRPHDFGPVSRGLLLYGVSGIGKTMLVNALATHYQCHVVRLNSSEMFSKFYGESESNVSRQFMEVFDVHPKPAMVIVEELHNLCPKSTSTDIVKRISQHFLNLLDSLHGSARGNRSIVIGTTDNIDSINPLLRRGGRMDYEFELPVPDAIARAAILERILSRHKQQLPSEAVQTVARITHGYVGADLENLVSKAASLSKTAVIDEASLMAATQHVKASAMREILIECPNVRWSDIGGQEELKLKLRQIIDWPIHHPELFTRLGIKPPRGLLMFGPPGCSKTMIAKAIATESRINFLSIKGSELFSMWVGESERAVRDLFRRARQVAPSIIFFDEIDAIGGERSGDTGSSVKERVLAQLLTEMDGVSTLKDVRIVAATNRPDLIDRALMRPGRLDRIVYVRLPDEAARREIFRIKLKTIPTAKDVNVEELVQRTAGCSGSEIEAICQEAALRGLESSFNVQTIEWLHFEHALAVVRPRTSTELLRLYDEYLMQHQ